MSVSEDRFQAVAADLAARSGVGQAKAFGMPGLKSNGKVFAGLFGEDMVFKLGAGEPAHEEALALDGARLWDPSGKDRPFKDWVQIPPAHADRWASLADRALEALRSR